MKFKITAWFCASICFMCCSSNLCMEEKKVYSKEYLSNLLATLRESIKNERLHPSQEHTICRSELYELIVNQNIEFDVQELDAHATLLCISRYPDCSQKLLQKLVQSNCDINIVQDIDKDTVAYTPTNYMLNLYAALQHHYIDNFKIDFNDHCTKIDTLVHQALRSGAKIYEKKALLEMLLIFFRNSRFFPGDTQDQVLNVMKNMISFGVNLDYVGERGSIIEQFDKWIGIPRENIIRCKFLFEMGVNPLLSSKATTADFVKNPPDELTDLIARCVKIHDASTDKYDLFKKAFENYTDEDQKLIKLAVDTYFYRNDFEKLRMLYKFSMATHKTKYFNPEELFEKSLKFQTSNEKSLPNQRIAYLEKLRIPRTLHNILTHQRGHDAHFAWQ